MLVGSRDKRKVFDLRITIDLVAPANQNVKWFPFMLHQKIHPERVITTFESRTSKIIWIDASAEAITLGPTNEC
jgi:hypothetical protein